MQKSGKEYNVANDSLSQKPLKELKALFWKNKRDSINSILIAQTYLMKAKQKDHRVKIADGYQMFIHLYKKQLAIKLKYADSIIEITKNVENSYYPSAGYILKGNILNSLERYNEALNSYFMAEKFAKANNSMGQLIGIKHNIALLKDYFGEKHEALKVFKENYEYLSAQDKVKKNSQIYTVTLYKVSDCFNKLKQYDSAHFYIKKGIKSSLSNNRYSYKNFLFLSGANCYFRKEYSSAKDSINKALSLFNTESNGINTEVRIGYLYLSKIYLDLDEEQKALSYLKKIEKITNEFNYELAYKDAFVLLIDYYKKVGDQKNQLRIMEKLIQYNNISEEKYKHLSAVLIEKYDTSNLVKDKNKLIKDIVSKNKAARYRLIGLGTLLLLLISLLYFYYKKRDKKHYAGVSIPKIRYS